MPPRTKNHSVDSHYWSTLPFQVRTMPKSVCGRLNYAHLEQVPQHTAGDWAPIAAPLLPCTTRRSRLLRMKTLGSVLLPGDDDLQVKRSIF